MRSELIPRSSVCPMLLWLAACHRPLPEIREDGAVRVTPGDGSEQNACLSPDGETLVFTRFLRGYNRGPAEIVALELASGRAEVLLPAGEHDHVVQPGRCSSSDGARLAYSSDERERDEIWVLDLERGQTTRLTDLAGHRSYEPSFARDDETIAFQSSEGDGPGDIYLLSPSGEARPLVSDPSDDRQPSASPTEDRVLFQSDRGGTWGLWTVSLRGGRPQLLLDTPAEETDASYAPDGAAVIFATDADCPGLSCAALLREGEVELLPAPRGWYDGAPALAPDGTVYVEATRGDPERGHDTAIYRLP